MNGSGWTVEELARLKDFLAGQLSREEHQAVVREIQQGQGAIGLEVKRLREADTSPLAIVERVLLDRSENISKETNLQRKAARANMPSSAGNSESSEPGDSAEMWRKFAIDTSGLSNEDDILAVILLVVAVAHTNSLRVTGTQFRSQASPVVTELQDLGLLYETGKAVTLRGKGIYLAFTKVDEENMGLRVGSSAAELFGDFTVAFLRGEQVILSGNSQAGQVLLSTIEVSSALSGGADRLEIRCAQLS